LLAVAVGIILPFTPAARILGFVPLPAGFFGALAAMIVMYLGLIEFTKRIFFGVPSKTAAMGKPS